jgi:peptidoglycan/LPS O-acetylase OafA/YrhL
MCPLRAHLNQVEARPAFIEPAGTLVDRYGMSTASLPQEARLAAQPTTSDRAFRPDIEGIRAIAVLMVVLAHAGVQVVRGGYVGVDVFFVLSGFLITGLLLREHLRANQVSLPDFYARRARRILPASTLVLVITVVATFGLLGSNRAIRVATDGQWASLFVANVRLIEEGTNYLSAQLPPSPLEHYWSLAVEEQFYLIWPSLLWLVIAFTGGRRLRPSLAGILVAVIGASLVWSVWQTGRDGTVAYFSPLTRAWELAAGALLAVGVPVLLRFPARLGMVFSIVGVVAIATAAVLYDNDTQFPGLAVALPVGGAFLVLSGGTIAPTRGLEGVLAVPPLQWLGKRSYAWYLWHWPVLVIVAARIGHPLSALENVGLCVVALGLAAISFSLIEHPIHHSTRLITRTPWLSVALGAMLVAGSCVTMGVLIARR